MAELAPDEKRCPSCAEAVKAAALRCRFCGYDFERARVPAPAPQNVRQPSGCGVAVGAVLGLMLLVFIASSIFGGGKDTAPRGSTAPTETPMAQAPLTPEVRKQCAALMKQGADGGLIRKVDRGTNRLYVDEPTWREIGPDARGAVWWRDLETEMEFNEGSLMYAWMIVERVDAD